MVLDTETGSAAHSRAVIKRLGAEQAAVRAQLDRAARAAGGMWTTRLRARQTQLTAQLRAARSLAERGP